MNKIAILLYHRLVVKKPENIYERNISDFIQDIDYLLEKDFKIISLDNLLTIKNEKKEFDRNCIAITFDDGNESDFSLVFPELKRRSIPASFFLVSNWVSKKGFLNSDKIQLMSETKGNQNLRLFSFESHTMSHPYLLKGREKFKSDIEYERFLEKEFQQSQSFIYKITKVKPKFLALPFGDGAWNPSIISVATRKGYNGIRSSIWDACTLADLNLHCMPGLPVLSETNIKDLCNRYL